MGHFLGTRHPVCITKIDDSTKGGLTQFWQGAEGRSEERRGLRTKALMRDLGTRLECRHRVFVRTGKTLWK